VSPKSLLVSSANDSIEELIDDELDYLRPETDREEIAAAFERYDYTEMPVVDRAGRLIGIVTVDDVLDIIRAEHTEDAYKMVGAGVGEAVYSSIGQKFRGRFPWLVVNVFTSMVAAFVVFQFDYLIAELAILAVMMPVIANQAGNAGQQSLAVTLRGLVLGEVRGKRAWPLVRREVTVGVINGFIVGSAIGLCVCLMALTGVRNVQWTLGIVIALAMTVSVAAGCLAGSAMPLLLDRFEYDPATGSTIFLTMVTDSVSFLTFLGLASILQHTLMLSTGG
jgi:magnesium transporter